MDVAAGHIHSVRIFPRSAPCVRLSPHTARYRIQLSRAFKHNLHTSSQRSLKELLVAYLLFREAYLVSQAWTYQDLAHLEVFELWVPEMHGLANALFV